MLGLEKDFSFYLQVISDSCSECYVFVTEIVPDLILVVLPPELFLGVLLSRQKPGC